MSSVDSLWQTILSDHLSPMTSSIATASPPSLIIAGPHAHLHGPLTSYLLECSSSSEDAFHGLQDPTSGISYHCLKVNYNPLNSHKTLNVFRVSSSEFLSFLPELAGSKNNLILPLDVQLIHGKQRKVTRTHVDPGSSEESSPLGDRKPAVENVTVSVESVSIIGLLKEWLSKIRICFGQEADSPDSASASCSVLVLLMNVDRMDVVVETLLEAKRKEIARASGVLSNIISSCGDSKAKPGGVQFSLSKGECAVSSPRQVGFGYTRAREAEENVLLRKSIMNWLQYSLRREVSEASAALMYVSIRDRINCQLLWDVVKEVLFGEQEKPRDEILEELRKRARPRNEIRLFIPWEFDSRVEMRRLAFPFLVEENVEATPFEKALPFPPDPVNLQRRRREFKTVGNPFQRFLKSAKFEMDMRRSQSVGLLPGVRGFEASRPPKPMTSPSKSTSTIPDEANPRADAIAILKRQWHHIREKVPGSKKARVPKPVPSAGPSLVINTSSTKTRAPPLSTRPHSGSRLPRGGRRSRVRAPFAPPPGRSAVGSDRHATRQPRRRFGGTELPQPSFPNVGEPSADRNAMKAFFDEMLTRLDSDHG